MLYSATTRWMNHPRNADRARLKPWQLRVAHLSGFAVLPTVFTTAPRLAQQFAEEHQAVVVKSASGPPPGEPALALPTTLIGPDADFSAVAAGPALLQRYIPKRADIRLTCVGARLFAARKRAEPGQVDGRYGDTGHAWEAVSVPERIGKSVHDYVALAGLAYAAFDFAEDEEGVWWFLECNPGSRSRRRSRCGCRSANRTAVFPRTTRETAPEESPRVPARHPPPSPHPPGAQDAEVPARHRGAGAGGHRQRHPHGAVGVLRGDNQKWTVS
jgi:hypothetical protein